VFGLAAKKIDFEKIEFDRIVFGLADKKIGLFLQNTY
jgi:hypothetical protein